MGLHSGDMSINSHMTVRLRSGSNPTLAGWQHMDSFELLRTPSSEEDEEFFDAHGNNNNNNFDLYSAIKSNPYNCSVALYKEYNKNKC